jgi:hypothetical protein
VCYFSARIDRQSCIPRKSSIPVRLNMKIRLAALGLLLLAASFPTLGDTISGSVTGGTALTADGIFVKLTLPLENPFGPPNSVGNDNFQSPNLFAFDEAQNIVLTASLTVDVGTSPIAARTVVSSQYVFFDPGPTQHMIGIVDFDANILGIITTTADLASSDFLAAAGVNYLNPANRGLEAGDSPTISGSKQILFDVSASSPGDYIRVITAASPTTNPMPEPSSLALLTAALLLFAFLFAIRFRDHVRLG